MKDEIDIEDEEQGEYNETARAVIKILKKNGCIRRADNIEPDGMSVNDIITELEDLGFNIDPPTYYNKIRPLCIEMGYDVTAHGRGQYIGKDGEWTRNIHYAQQQVAGRAHNQRKVLTAKAYDLKSLEAGNKYAREHFKMDLAQSAKFFRIVGDLTGDNLLAWPKEIEEFLLQTGD